MKKKSISRNTTTRGREVVCGNSFSVCKNCPVFYCKKRIDLDTNIVYGIPQNILDKKEKEYLFNVIAPFRKLVIFISKQHYFINGDDFTYCIRIVYTRRSAVDVGNMFLDDVITLPPFDARIKNMYSGMKLNGHYTLKELNLK